MRLAVPVSGGLDSAILLAETLASTPHEVLCVHVSEQDAHGAAVPGWERDREGARRVVEWCGANIRPVAAFVEAPLVARYGDGRGVPEDLELAYRHPDAPYRHPYYVSGLIWCSIGAELDRLRPDEAWMGTQAWNFRGRAGQGLPAYEALRSQTSVPVRHPFLEEAGFARGYPLKDVAWGAGRLAQIRRLPPALRGAVLGCRRPSNGVACGRCDNCVTERFYEAFCKDVSDAELARIEGLIERDGKFGRWYGTADPQVFRRHDLFDLLRDHDYWQGLLACDEAGAAAMSAAKQEEIEVFNAARRAA